MTNTPQHQQNKPMNQKRDDTAKTDTRPGSGNTQQPQKSSDAAKKLSTHSSY